MLEAQLAGGRKYIFCPLPQGLKPLNLFRVFQKINDPKPVIASEAKQSQSLRLLRFARNDNWAFFYKAFVIFVVLR